MEVVLTVPQGYKPAGFEQVTVDDSADALTVPLNACFALITVEDATVRFRNDGTDPTSTVGHPLYQNNSMLIEGRDVLSALKFIKTGATNAKLNVTYYRR